MSDSLYRERAHLLALLTTHYPSHIQADTAEPDWPVLHISLPTGQCTWHLSDADLDLFEHVRTDTVETWDGHTNEEKYARVDELTRIRAVPMDGGARNRSRR